MGEMDHGRTADGSLWVKYEKQPNNIQVEEATEHCNCNACGAINYESRVSPRLFNRVDRLLSVSAGGMTITLCPSCALKLVQLIEPEICETV